MLQTNQTLRKKICYLLFYGVQLQYRKQKQTIYKGDEECSAVPSFTKITESKTNYLKGKPITLSDVGFHFYSFFSPHVTGSAAMALISSKLGLGRKDYDEGAM